MPTGYTYKIVDGQSFEEFALGCARAFGACIEMKDDPADMEIPVFEVDDYEYDKLDEAQQELDKWVNMSYEDKVKYIDSSYERSKKSVLNSISTARKEQKAYDNMLAQVITWPCPTAKHIKYKEFMIEQIEISMPTGYDLSKTDEELLSERYQEVIDYAVDIEYQTESKLWHLAYASEKLVEAFENTKARNDWVNAIKDSFRLQVV
jgi:hypothetical protein